MSSYFLDSAGQYQGLWSWCHHTGILFTAVSILWHPVITLLTDTRSSRQCVLIPQSSSDLQTYPAGLPCTSLEKPAIRYQKPESSQGGRRLQWERYPPLLSGTTHSYPVRSMGGRIGYYWVPACNLSLPSEPQSHVKALSLQTLPDSQATFQERTLWAPQSLNDCLKKKRKQSHWNDSLGKGTRHQAWWLEFKPENSRGRRRELNPRGCVLWPTFTGSLAHHTQINPYA